MEPSGQSALHAGAEPRSFSPTSAWDGDGWVFQEVTYPTERTLQRLHQAMKGLEARYCNALRVICLLVMSLKTVAARKCYLEKLNSTSSYVGMTNVFQRSDSNGDINHSKVEQGEAVA